MLKVAQSMQLCILQLVRQLTSEFAPSSLDCLLADLFDIPGLLKSKTKNFYGEMARKVAHK